MTDRVGILDTNAVILLDELNAAHLPKGPVITAITLAEPLVGPLATDDPVERAARQIRRQEAESGLDALPFDAVAARTCGRVATGPRRSGRRVQARAFDAHIAATALAHRLPVHTCSPRDSGIDGLAVVALPHPDERSGR